MKRANAVGFLYFSIHLLVEITSFYVLTSYIQSPYVWLLMLLYDFAAFVPQGVFGFMRDLGLRVNFALVGTALTTLSLVMMIFDLNAFAIIFVISIGNCLVHIHGAQLTLRTSPGKITPSALFVSGGSFGVIAGKLLSSGGVPALWVLLLNLLTIAPILTAEKLKEPDGSDNLKKYNFSDTKLPTALVIGLAVFVVAVRSFMGYGIPTSWNKTVIQTVMLYCFMGIGKAMGGVLTDLIGIRKTALISTLGALPLLLFGAEVMPVSLVGIAFFSMTMAVTLAIIVSRLQQFPGVSFGFTTVGLFLGTVPVFFFRIHDFWVNCIVITVLSVLCVVILFFICAKPAPKKQIIKE